jgi:hypothetical protein
MIPVSYAIEQVKHAHNLEELSAVLKKVLPRENTAQEIPILAAQRGADQEIYSGHRGTDQ